MSRISVLVSTLIVLSLVLAVVPIGAVAQEASPTEIETEESAQENEYLQEIDPTLRLIEWEYDGSKFTLTLESDISNRLTATEAVQFKEGSGQLTIEQHNIPRGTSTVTVHVEPRNGEAGLVLTTSASIHNGTGTFISTGQTEAQESPFARTSSTAGWVGGAGTVGLMFTFVALRELRKEPDAPEVVK